MTSAPNWTQLSPTISPNLRFWGTMVYDAADAYVMLFGGVNYSGFLGDTWKFVGGQWTNITPAVSPSARSNSVMAYDAADGYVVLFGGAGHLTNCCGDTWKFVGGQWTNITPTTSPSAREWSMMAYDAADSYVVLFGGVGSSGNILGDTWKFVGGQWTNITPTTSPRAREGSMMEYDAADDYAVLFGGCDISGIDCSPTHTLGDTWKFAGGQWTNITPTTSPSAREWSMSSYDSTDGYVVLFGGDNGWFNGNALNDTWKFSGDQWTQLFPYTSPSERYDGLMVYDAVNGYVMLYGGCTGGYSDGCPGYHIGDTWKFVSGPAIIPWTNLSIPFSGSAPGFCNHIINDENLLYDPESAHLLLFDSSVAADGMCNTVFKLENDRWIYLSFGPSDPPGSYYRLADFPITYDAGDGYFLAYGGSYQDAGGTDYESNLTWEYQGGNWTELFPLHTPDFFPVAAGGSFPGSAAKDLVYDAAENESILLGPGSTWAYHAGDWTNVTSGVQPPYASGDRYGSYFAMAYDSAASEVLLFEEGQTWVYSHGSWTNLTSSLPTSPPAVVTPSLSDDPASGGAILFGGSVEAPQTCTGGPGNTQVNYTWLFSGGVWTNVSVPLSPSPRLGSGMVYDPTLGGLVLWGGFPLYDSCGDFINDTWEYGAGPITLTSVAISPTGATVALGGSQSFVATPTCSSTCPSGTSYSWTITNSAMGSLNTSAGSPVTFTAGSTAGTVGIFVNATLFGNTKQSAAAIVTITNTGGWHLVSVAISPLSVTLASGDAQSFVSTPTCTTTCPSGTTYSWTLTNNTVGQLNTTTGASVTFTANSTAGVVDLFVNATLNGITEQSSAAIITITTTPITLTSVTVSPTAPSVGASTGTVFTATPTCSVTCPETITYAWALTSGTLGSLSGSGATVTFTAGTTSGTVGIFVNATLSGTIEGASTVITVTTTPITLSSVAVNPSSDTIYVGGIANFTATPGCTGGTCPAGIAYSWFLSNTLGNVNNQTGSKTTFTAGPNAGSVTLTVTATLNGNTATNSATITITSTPPPALTAVFVNPSSANVEMNGTQTFAATPTCTGGTCLPGTTYFWSLTNNLGKLNSTAANIVTFTAGSTAGTVVLFVNATLNGKTVLSSPVVITIKEVSPSSKTGFLGLPGNLGYILVLTVMLVVAVALSIAVLVSRRSGRDALKHGLTTGERTTPHLPPQSEYKVPPKTPPHPPSGDGGSKVLDPNDPLRGLV